MSNPNLVKICDHCLAVLTRLKAGPPQRLAELLVLEKTLLQLKLIELAQPVATAAKPARPHTLAVEEQILSLLQNGQSLTSQGILTGLNQPISRRGLKRYLARLVTAGKLSREMVNHNYFLYRIRGI